MKTNLRSVLPVKTVLLPLIIMAIFYVRPALGDDVVPYKSITPLEESTIERTAIIVLSHIAKARSDIHRKTFARARRDVAEAARLMTSIREDLSTSTAKKLIETARIHLEFEQPHRVLRDFPLIYASLERISIYFPTDKAKMHLDRAKGYLERNDKREAGRELAQADKSLLVIEVELPLLKAQRYVAQAEGFLAARNPKKADKALELAEQRAQAIYTGLTLPILQARRNISLAFRNYSSARPAEAQAYLEEARNHLNRVAAGGSAKEKQEAGKLSQEVAQLQKKLTGEEKAVESDFKAVYEKSSALAERAAAYLSTGLSEEETTLRGEDNLLEAKLHVAYAETYQVTTGEPGKAAEELGKVDSYLHKALRGGLVDKAVAAKINGLDREVMMLKADTALNDTAVQDRYESIEDGLNALIREI